MKGGIYSLLMVYLEIMYTTFDYLLSFHCYFLRQANQAITNIRSGRATMYFQLKLPTVRSCCNWDLSRKALKVCAELSRTKVVAPLSVINLTDNSDYQIFGNVRAWVIYNNSCMCGFPLYPLCAGESKIGLVTYMDYGSPIHRFIFLGQICRDGWYHYKRRGSGGNTTPHT